MKPNKEQRAKKTTKLTAPKYHTGEMRKISRNTEK